MNGSTFFRSNNQGDEADGVAQCIVLGASQVDHARLRHIHKAKVDHLQDLLKKIKTGDDSDSTKKEDVLATCE